MCIFDRELPSVCIGHGRGCYVRVIGAGVQRKKYAYRSASEKIRVYRSAAEKIRVQVSSGKNTRTRNADLFGWLTRDEPWMIFNDQLVFVAGGRIVQRDVFVVQVLAAVFCVRSNETAVVRCFEHCGNGPVEGGKDFASAGVQDHRTVALFPLAVLPNLEGGVYLHR